MGRKPGARDKIEKDRERSGGRERVGERERERERESCLLYTSDAADEHRDV